MYRNRLTGALWFIVKDSTPENYLMRRSSNEDGVAVFTEVAKCDLHKLFEYVIGSEAAHNGGGNGS